MSKNERRRGIISDRKEAIRVTLVYVVLAALWVFASDTLLDMTTSDPDTYRAWQLYKDWLFILATAIVFYWIVSSFVTAIDAWDEALRGSEERLASFRDSVPIALASTDLEGRFTYVNPAYCRLFGMDSEDLLGRSASEITGLSGVLPEYSPEGTIAHARTHREGWRGEALRKDRHGRIVPLYVSVAQLRDPGGDPAGYVGLLVDLREATEWPPYLGGFARILERLTTSGDSEELTRAAVAEAVALTAGDVGLIADLDPGTDELRCRWSVGYEDGSGPEVLPPGPGLWTVAIRKGEAALLEDSGEMPEQLPVLPDVDVASGAAVPIARGGKIRGVLLVGCRERSYTVSRRHLGMLQAIADLVALALYRDGE